MLTGSSDLWWSGAINICVSYVLKVANRRNDAIVTLNNDLEINGDYLDALVRGAKLRPGCLITSASYDIRTEKLIEPGTRQSWITSRVSKLNPVSDCEPDTNALARVSHAPGRGTLVPIEVYEEIGLYDELRLPHYGADYDFTFRACRRGHPVYISYEAKVFSHSEETGMTKVRRELSWKEYIHYLSDIRSPANLGARWWVAVKNCPWYFLPSYLVLDFCAISASYLKYHLQK